MELEYILGSQRTWEEVQTLPTLIPFDKDTIEFFDQVSKALMKQKGVKEFPDVVTFAFWCRRASVIEMKKKIAWLTEAEKRGVLGRGIAFHIAPGNVAMNFAYSFAASALAGNSNIVRLPSKAFPQVDLLCKVLESVLNEMPEWRKRLCFLRYGHEREITDKLSAISDIRIIWGGDRTIQEIRKSPLKIRGKEIVFADRYSLAVIDAEEYLLLKEEQKQQKAREFYNDTYLMDQNACTSPMLVIWKGNREIVKKAQKTFWAMALEVVKEKYPLLAVQAVKKLQAAYRLAAAIPNTILTKNDRECVPQNNSQLETDNRLIRVHVAELSDHLMNYRENSGFFMEYETECLEDLIPICTNRCQTISYLGDFLEQELRDLMKRCRPSGVDRIVPMGKTMDFSLIWDGYDLIREMSREIC